MKAVVILSHMALAQVLVLGTLIGLAGAEDQGGYLSEFLAIGSPFVLGLQIMHIVNSFKE
jgi:hypothetical protein